MCKSPLFPGSIPGPLLPLSQTSFSALQGLLLPLCAGGDCTLREAFIVSSVLRRVSLPVPHAAAALLRISDMEFTGTNSFFIRVLLDKKYALPYRVVSEPSNSAPRTV